SNKSLRFRFCLHEKSSYLHIAMMLFMVSCARASSRSIDIDMIKVERDGSELKCLMIFVYIWLVYHSRLTDFAGGHMTLQAR
ncbi:hypothetical protein EDB19DRAFT_1753636, partial [Suillus lakei]